jgi:hypothetical protein
MTTMISIGNVKLGHCTSVEVNKTSNQGDKQQTFDGNVQAPPGIPSTAVTVNQIVLFDDTYEESLDLLTDMENDAKTLTISEKFNGYTLTTICTGTTLTGNDKNNTAGSSMTRNLTFDAGKVIEKIVKTDS